MKQLKLIKTRRFRQAVLNIFYSLTLTDVLLILLEKLYYKRKLIYLLKDVNKEIELGLLGMASVDFFCFFNAYSRFLLEAFLSSLNWTLCILPWISWPRVLLMSSCLEHKYNISLHEMFALIFRWHSRRSVMERLLKMLNWKNQQEVEIRHSAVKILS